MKSAIWIKSFNRWLNESQYSEPVLLVLASGFIGLTTGVGVWAFKKLIEVCTHFSFTTLAGWLSAWGHWTIALIPLLGGVVVGLLVHFFIGEERHHGVAGIMEAVALAGGRLRYQRIVQKSSRRGNIHRKWGFGRARRPVGTNWRQPGFFFWSKAASL